MKLTKNNHLFFNVFVVWQMGLDTWDLQFGRGSFLQFHLGRASSNATTMKATPMKVIAFGYRFKSRSSILFQTFNCWKVKTKSDPKPSVYPRATFHRTCSALSAGALAPGRGLCLRAGQSYLLALYLDLLASRGSLLGLLQSSASGLVL